MVNAIHANQDVNDGIHIIHAYELSDAAALASASFTSADIGKVVRQLDTNEFYIIKDTTPSYQRIDGYALPTGTIADYGAILYFDGSDWVKLDPGPDGYVLITHGVGSDPEWTFVAGAGGQPTGAAGGDLGGTYPNPNVTDLTISGEQQGSVLYFNGSSWVQLAPGTDGYFLSTNGVGQNPSWEEVVSSGGSPTGSAGGDLSGTYPNPTVTDLTISSEEQGSVLYFNGSNWVQLAPSDDGYVLTTHSTGADPTWEFIDTSGAPTGTAGGDLSGTYPNPTVTDLTISSEEQGSILYFDGSNWVQLAPSDDGYVLTTHSTGQDPTWEQGSGSGLPTGPAGGDLSGTYPNPTVTDLTISSEEQGSILYFNGSSWVQLAPSDDGYVLTTHDTGSDPTWEFVDTSGAPTGSAGGDLGGTYPNPEVNDLTIAGEEQGSILYFDGYNWIQLAPSDDGYVLTTHSTGQDPTWEQGSGSGLPTGSAGGDLSGTYPNPTVVDLTISSEEQGSILYFDGSNWVQLSPGDDGYVLTTHGTGADPEWLPDDNDTTPTGAAGGDLGGTYPNPTVVDLTIASEERGSILYFDGYNWVQLSPSTDGYFLSTNGPNANPSWEFVDTSGTPTGSASGDLSGTYPNPTVVDLTITDEEQGSILYFDGSNWVQLAPGDDGYVLTTHGIGADPEWLPDDNDTIPSGPAGGDLGGIYPNPEVNDLTITGEEQGSILYFDGYNWVQLVPSTDGYFLSTNGSGQNPSWEFVDTSGAPTGAAGGDLSGTYPNPTVTDLTIASEEQGSILYFDGSNWVQLAPSDDGYVLTTHSTGADPTWEFVDTSGAPTGSAGGDLGGTYPNPEVNDLTITGEEQGSILYFDGSNWVQLPPGTDGYVLITNGVGADPSWTFVAGAGGQPTGAAGGDLGGTYPSPIVVDLTITDEEQGSVLYFDGSNWVQLAPGTDGYVLTTRGTGADPEWTNESGGSPSGPAGGDLNGTYPNPEVNDLTISSEEQGSILYFDGSNWVQLSPGDDGYVLTTHGIGADPEWLPDDNDTVPTGSAGGDLGGTYPNPEVNDLTITSEEQGSILYFDGYNWVQLSPSTDGYFLSTNGAGQNPSWEFVDTSGAPTGPAGGDLSGTYPNPTVTDLTISSEEQGSILYFDGSNWVQLAPSDDGYVLTTHSTGADPTWEFVDVSGTPTGAAGGDLGGTYPNPTVVDLTITDEEQGSILYFDGSNWVQLAPGTDGYVLKTHGTGANPEWLPDNDTEGAGGETLSQTLALGNITDGYDIVVSANDAINFAGEVDIQRDGYTVISTDSSGDLNFGSASGPVIIEITDNGVVFNSDVDIDGYLEVTTYLGLDEQSSVPGGTPLSGKGKVWLRDDGYLILTDDLGSDNVIYPAVLTGIAGGDLSGTYPNPEVNDLTIAGEEQGSILYFDGLNWVQLAPNDDGYVLTTHSTGANPTWEFIDTSGAPTGSAGGDLGGTYPNPTVTDLTISSEEQGSILYFDGSNWVQLAPSDDGYVLTTHSTGADPTWEFIDTSGAPSGSAGGDLSGTYPNPTVTDLTISSEEQGSILYFDGSNWVQLSPGDDGYVLKTHGTGANPEWLPDNDTGSLGGETLNQTLALGNITDGYDIVVSANDAINFAGEVDIQRDGYTVISTDASGDLNFGNVTGPLIIEVTDNGVVFNSDVDIDGYLEVTTYLGLDEQSSVPGGTPLSGKGKVWLRDDGYLILTNDAGTDNVLGAGGGGGGGSPSGAAGGDLGGTYPNPTVTDLTISSEEQGSILYFDGSNWVQLAPSTDGYVLTTRGTGADPEWTNESGGSPSGSAGGDLGGTYPNPEVNDLTISSEEQGSILYFDGSNWVRLAPSDDGYVLTTHGTGADPTWESGSGSAVAFSAVDDVGLTNVDAGWTDIPLDVVHINTGEFSHTLNTSEVTVLQAGTYLVCGHVSTSVTSGSGRSDSDGRLLLNDSEVEGTVVNMYNREAGNGESTGAFTVVLELSANDVLEIQAQKDNDGGNTIVTAPSGSGISIVKLSSGGGSLTGDAGGDLGGTYPNPEVNDLTITNEEQGSILYFDGYNWVQLAPSTDGYFLSTNGSGANPSWEFVDASSAPTGPAGGDLSGTYPNPTVTDLTIASEEQGSILYFDGSNWVQLAPGTDGYVLITNGPGADPSWTFVAGAGGQPTGAAGGDLGGTYPFPTVVDLTISSEEQGSILYFDGSNWVQLAPSDDGYVLTTHDTGADPTWSPAASSDPTGPAGGDLGGTYPNPEVNDLTITSEEQGSILYFDGSNWVQLAPGPDGYVLITNGVGEDPSWTFVAGAGGQPTGNAGGDLGGTYPFPTVVDLTITNEEQGSILYFDGSNWVQLAPGTDGYFLSTNGAGSNPTWEQGGASVVEVFLDASAFETTYSDTAVLPSLIDRNGNKAVACVDSTDNQGAIFKFWVPTNYDGYSAANIEVIIIGMAETATTGDVVLEAAFESGVGQDHDSGGGFGAAKSVTLTVPSTSGYDFQNEPANLTFDNSEADGLSAGSLARIRINRNATSGSDTAADDYQLRGCIIRMPLS